MKLQNPQTKKQIEVPEEHGEMLLRQGFYRLVTTETKKQSRKVKDEQSTES